MNNQNDVIPFGQKTDSEWKEYLRSGQKHSAESMLEFATRVVEFNTKCAAVSGGTTFSESMKEWLGMEQQASSMWLAIGNDSRLSIMIDKLPASYSIAYKITTLSNAELKQGVDSGAITSETTQRQMTAFKRSFNPPVPKPKKPKVSDTDSLNTYLAAIFNLLPATIAQKIKPKKGEIPSFTYQGLLVSKKKVLDAVNALSRKQSATVVEVFIDILAYQEKAFDIIQKERKTKANRALESRLKKELAHQKEKTEQITKENVVLPQFAFSKEEIKLIRSCLHPDRECKPERKAKAFNAFQRLFK